MFSDDTVKYVFGSLSLSPVPSLSVPSSYLQSNASKNFQRCVIDMLEDPEVVSTMVLPGTLVSVCVCVCSKIQLF